ncbi:Cellular retinaldehyde-binding triple function domain containing protein [Aphelenchoides besseyi]|nr:Cellular retinaldehyde-binding triple function domain containing protein [Aphelenchoides besseyi]KAI6199162.1 Cellular retinaldehyde-binding triple function domain containing protein [Aphelenchoides besseyi]
MPEQQTGFVRPEPFSEQEIENARALRAKLGALLPADYNTDYFVGRWLRAYKGDEAAIIQKLGELVAHRKAFGYNEENILEFCEQNPIAKSTFERFGISTLKMDVFSDDVAVFIQRMENTDIKEIMKIMPLSNVLHSYFFLHECFQRSMHEHERKTGRPSAVVVVLDLKGLNLGDFINPLSTSSKLARLVVMIWSAYFSENMIGLFLINPPGILSLMWQVAKHIVDAKTQSRIKFVPKLEDIFTYLKKEAVPEIWSGKRRDENSPNPSACIRTPLPIQESDFFTPEKYWKNEHGFSTVPETKSVALKSKNVHEIAKECKSGQKLIWLFTVNADITFEIAFTSGEEDELVWPRVILTSLKTPEIGNINCEKEGTYRLRFANISSSWLSTKLQYAVEVK